MTATLSRQRFIERAILHGRVDRAAGIIRGVRILGENSRNNRRYTSEAMRAGAPLYEGARVFIDHQRSDDTRDRPFQDWVGNLQNVRFERGGLVGDLKLRRESTHFGAICEAAESDEFNQSFGLSHEANGESHYDRAAGVEVIERITSVYAVAIVTDPATTRGLYESQLYADEAQQEIEALAASVREFRDLALERLELAFRTSDASASTAVPSALADLGQRLDQWIESPQTGVAKAAGGEVRHIVDALAEIFRDPLVAGSPEQAEAALDDLVKLVDDLAAGNDLMRPDLTVPPTETVTQESWGRRDESRRLANRLQGIIEPSDDEELRAFCARLR